MFYFVLPPVKTEKAFKSWSPFLPIFSVNIGHNPHNLTTYTFEDFNDRNNIKLQSFQAERKFTSSLLAKGFSSFIKFL